MRPQLTVTVLKTTTAGITTNDKYVFILDFTLVTLTSPHTCYSATADPLPHRRAATFRGYPRGWPRSLELNQLSLSTSGDEDSEKLGSS